MSLEEAIFAVAEAIDRHTAVQAQLLSQARQAPQTVSAAALTGAATSDAETPQGEAPAPAPKRGPGRPPKAMTNPPPSPMATAAAAAAASQAASPNSNAQQSPVPAPAATSTAATPASAPAAGSGSAAPTDVGAMYDELKGLVTEYSATHGRTACMALFAEYDIATPAALKEPAYADKLPVVLERFRAECAS